VRSLRDANVYEAQRYRHINRPGADRGGGGGRHGGGQYGRCADELHRRAHQCTPGETTLFATGRYQDRIVFDDGAARFARRP